MQPCKTLFVTYQVNLEEFQKLQLEVKKTFLSHGQATLRIFNEIYIAWQDIRRQLLMLDEAVFENMDDRRSAGLNASCRLCV